MATPPVQAAATRTVKFEFQCLNDSGYKSLKFTREMPSSLVTKTPAPNHTQVLHAAMVPILQEHDFACRAACSKVCNVCGDQATDIHIMPMLHLRVVEDPMIDIYVHAVCAKPECPQQTQHNWQRGLAEAESQAVNKSSRGLATILLTCLHG